MSEFALVVENLSKAYVLGKNRDRKRSSSKLSGPDKLWALQDVSFAARLGSVLGIIGPNGAGKTTLLKVISRVTPPTKGRVRGHGRVVSLLEMGLGFQPDMSAVENIYLTGALFGFNGREVDKRMNEIVDFAGLAGHMDRVVSRFSSGMYLRLAFSVAINMAPDILLADEVLAVGDADFQRKCLERTREEADRGRTVLFVSHDMKAITQLCDEALCLNAGQIVARGSPDSVVEFYQGTVFEDVHPIDADGMDNQNSQLQITGVRLLSGDGDELSAARVSTETCIGVTFRTRCTSGEIRPSLDLFSKDVLVFSSAPQNPISVCEPGIYTAVVKIPPFMLAETIYSASVSVRIDYDNQRHAAKKYNAIRFRVYDDAAMSEGINELRKKPVRGVIAPRLDWELIPSHVEQVRRVAT